MRDRESAKRNAKMRKLGTIFKVIGFVYAGIIELFTIITALFGTLSFSLIGAAPVYGYGSSGRATGVVFGIIFFLIGTLSAAICFVMPYALGVMLENNADSNERIMVLENELYRKNVNPGFAEPANVHEPNPVPVAPMPAPKMQAAPAPKMNAAPATEMNAAPAQEVHAAPEAPKAPEMSKDWICPKCGHGNTGRFCVYCGTERA